MSTDEIADEPAAPAYLPPDLSRLMMLTTPAELVARASRRPTRSEVNDHVMLDL